MPEPTVIACLTPPGVGAIATLAVRGPLAWSITRTLFRASLPEQPIPGRFYLGRLGAESKLCDQVVLAVKADSLELHCHGGVEVVRFIQDLFAERGVQPCSWDQPAITDGMSHLGRLAQAQLLQAPTVKTAAILLDQMHGAFETTLAEIIGGLRHQEMAYAGRRLARLVQTQHLGRHLVRPFRIVIAGAPNVGKSSLVNALAGFTRSLVSPVAGTTRDIVTTRSALDGWPIELHDTAGFHTSEDFLEREGMTRARAALEQADLRLWVLDASAAPRLPPPEFSFAGTIINKVDLPRAWEDSAMQLELPSQARHISCTTGHGIKDLCQWIALLLGVDQELIPGEAMAFLPELCDQVLDAYGSLRTNPNKVARMLEACADNSRTIYLGLSPR